MNEEERGRPIRENAARTRARLLEAAAEVFAHRGFDGAGVDEIAAAAGVSVGSIYSRFGSKHGLFAAMLTDHLDREAARARDGITRGMDVWLIGIDDMVREAAGSRRQTLLDAEAWASAMRSPEIRRTLVRHDTQIRETAVRALAEHRERAGLRLAMSDEDLDTVLAALYHGLLRQLRIGRHVPPDLYGRTLAALMRGLAVPAGGAPGGGPGPGEA